MTYEQIAEQIAAELAPVFLALKGDMDKRFANLDARFELERAFNREVVKAATEPLRQREQRLADKLAAIEQVLAQSRKAA